MKTTRTHMVYNTNTIKHTRNKYIYIYIYKKKTTLNNVKATNAHTHKQQPQNKNDYKQANKTNNKQLQ